MGEPVSLDTSSASGCRRSLSGRSARGAAHATARARAESAEGNPGDRRACRCEAGRALPPPVRRRAMSRPAGSRCGESARPAGAARRRPAAASATCRPLDSAPGRGVVPASGREPADPPSKAPSSSLQVQLNWQRVGQAKPAAQASQMRRSRRGACSLRCGYCLDSRMFSRVGILAASMSVAKVALERAPTAGGRQISPCRRPRRV
jgi:hypothetical protein